MQEIDSASKNAEVSTWSALVGRIILPKSVTASRNVIVLVGKVNLINLLKAVSLNLIANRATALFGQIAWGHDSKPNDRWYSENNKTWKTFITGK